MDASDQKGQAFMWKEKRDSLASFKISSVIFLELLRIPLKYYSYTYYSLYIKSSNSDKEAQIWRGSGNKPWATHQVQN